MNDEICYFYGCKRETQEWAYVRLDGPTKDPYVSGCESCYERIKYIYAFGITVFLSKEDWEISKILTD